MAQPSVAAFFNTRKRAAGDDITGLKNKRLVDPISQDNAPSTPTQTTPKPSKDAAIALRTRSGRTVKRTASFGVAAQSEVLPPKISKIEQNIKQKKLVEFIKKGPLSPRKKAPTKTQNAPKAPRIEETPKSVQATLPSNAIAAKGSTAPSDLGMKTPTKQIIKEGAPLKHGEIKDLVRKELNFDEVKTKITRSAKLQELKASLGRIQELEKTRKAQEARNKLLREGGAKDVKKTPIVQLKEFDTIELEVLTSPSKTFKTPTKLPPSTPDKNELMSPRHTDVSKRVLFSPAKNGTAPVMIVPPAYQRYQNLATTSKAGQLPLPFKYRQLVEVFKGVDAVCAMFHNRRECITFKKLKPAVQRMLRKNFDQRHLAQIKQIFPEAFIYTQMKMRNYGSISKADYFQLVIAPNVDNASAAQPKNGNFGEDVLTTAQATSMNPQVMTQRLQYFQSVLLERVKEAHDKFLRSLDPPLVIPMAKVTRWHPDFDLEKCPDIEAGHLPQPPNVEKYSSARDILSTARNLFNCSTPMERVLERYEAKLDADRSATNSANNLKHPPLNDFKTDENSSDQVSVKSEQETKANDVTAALLKGIPKSLLEKIRAKQAAKALDAMTRRPSQDQEATKYSRLPELARHLRNVFVSERKGVLTFEVITKKIQNSYRTSMTPQEVETHLRILAKEVPEWVSFIEVRQTLYLKISRNMEMGKIIEKLETAANEKSK